jgi:GNAT superfamily N-acetyltransferase
MQFNPVFAEDLDALKSLQPPDWSDIIPEIDFYIRAGYCHPIKVISGNRIAGLGASIIYGTTAWLAHIIVHNDFRRQGIGFAIVEELLKISVCHGVKTCMLTATELGKPVYTRAGFRAVSEYVFLNREEPWQRDVVSENIIPFEPRYHTELVHLDYTTTGENRELLLNSFLDGGKIYIKENTLRGFYLPALKEGPVFAQNTEAGIALMNLKCESADRVVIPAENTECLNFLKSKGYTVKPTKATRMIRGDEITWKPSGIFSRAGGNFG